MYKLTRLVTLVDGADADRLTDQLRTLAGEHAPRRALVAPTMAGSHFGGDLIAHFQFDVAEAREAFEDESAQLFSGPDIVSVDSVAYRGTADGVRAPALRDGVYRVLLLCVEDSVAAELAASFETETRAMPHYIPAIRNWQLSRVETGSGARVWTHVWEQEYADATGLLGPYMLHPYHWAHVDRWFDPECPDRIVDTRLCHSFCAIESTVLGA